MTILLTLLTLLAPIVLAPLVVAVLGRRLNRRARAPTVPSAPGRVAVRRHRAPSAARPDASRRRDAA